VGNSTFGRLSNECNRWEITLSEGFLNECNRWEIALSEGFLMSVIGGK
jgi:hypothetical protein